eukprot:jgi/Bigna1/83894/fgenesh1_pg.117_\
MRTLEFDRNLGHLVEAVEMMDLAHGETPKCTLFTSSFDYAIQGVLGLLALASLWVKFRIFDDVKARSFYTWTLDTAKQAFGGILAHFLNIGMAKRLHQSVKEVDAKMQTTMVYYAASLDIIPIGRMFSKCTHFTIAQVSYLFGKCDEVIFAACGGQSPDERSLSSHTIFGLLLLLACLVWVLMVAITKSAIFIVEMMFLHEIDHSGYYLLFPLHQAPKVKLILVMVVAPLVMTSCGFWMVDTWIMGANNSSASNNDTRCCFEEYAKLYSISPVFLPIVPFYAPLGISTKIEEDELSSPPTPIYEQRGFSDRCFWQSLLCCAWHKSLIWGGGVWGFLTQKTGEYSETSNADATGLMSKDIAEAGAYHDDAIVIKAPRAHRHPKYISGESDVNDDDGAEAVRTCFLATGDSTSRGGGGDNDNERSVREEEEEGLLVATTR